MLEAMLSVCGGKKPVGNETGVFCDSIQAKALRCQSFEKMWVYILDIYPQTDSC
jgi:hypothetical protein